MFAPVERKETVIKCELKIKPRSITDFFSLSLSSLVIPAMKRAIKLKETGVLGMREMTAELRDYRVTFL